VEADPGGQPCEPNRVAVSHFVPLGWWGVVNTRTLYDNIATEGENMKPIRNSSKAVIIQNHQVLLTKNKDDWGYFYLFPGGGQEAGETLIEAVYRDWSRNYCKRLDTYKRIHWKES
jgi:hypothetical protein